MRSRKPHEVLTKLKKHCGIAIRLMVVPRSEQGGMGGSLVLAAAPNFQRYFDVFQRYFWRERGRQRPRHAVLIPLLLGSPQLYVRRRQEIIPTLEKSATSSGAKPVQPQTCRFWWNCRSSEFLLPLQQTCSTLSEARGTPIKSVQQMLLNHESC